MKHLPTLLRIAVIVVLLLLPAGLIPLAQAQSGPVVIVEVEGVINPLTQRYLERSLAEAQQRGARMVVLTLDTPGGLESAMREMVQSMLQSPIPVVVYVAPPGARATSAGMFLLLAGHVAAMAPATHVGAAHPVPLGAEMDDVMQEKVTSDAAALARSVATDRGRNADWAERAVRESLSLTAREALDEDVIDLMAEDLDDLLARIDGMEVTTSTGPVTLRTDGAMLETEPMTLVERLMHVITDPNIAYLMLSLGTLLLLAELAEPGLSLPGIGAAICFIIAFMALGSLPVNWAGVALLAVGVVFFVVGLLTDTEPVVTVLGLVPFILGSLLLFTPFRPTSPAAPTLRVSPWLVGVMAVSILGFSFVVLRAVVGAVRLPPQAGAQRLVGLRGEALSDLTPSGQVRVDLEEWSAVSLEGAVRAGEPVKVVGIAGVRLQVVPYEPGGDEPL